LPYYDFTSSGALTWMVEAFKQWAGSSDVPRGVRDFPEGHLAATAGMG
jgi:hypothetical protein